jgi:hypothetical protein
MADQLRAWTRGACRVSWRRSSYLELVATKFAALSTLLDTCMSLFEDRDAPDKSAPRAARESQASAGGWSGDARRYGTPKTSYHDFVGVLGTCLAPGQISVDWR